MTDTIPWVEKYRPTSFDEIISHNDVVSTLQKLIQGNKFPHTILFGPPGTGKTSTIITCAKYIYGDNYKSMVLELNGSDDRGIKVVREQIKEFSEYNQLFCNGVKLVILDEADSMTYDAQFALRRVIENYTHNTRFCLVCNYITKIIPALQSRCIIFRFGQIHSRECNKKLKKILELENINYTLGGIRTILKIANGDMRQSINLLQSISMATPIVNENNVYKCAGEPSQKVFKNIYNYLQNNTFEEIYMYINNIRLSYGLSLVDLIKRLNNIIFSLDISDNQLSDLIINLAIIEYNLSSGGSDDIQLAGIIACFCKLRTNK